MTDKTNSAESKGNVALSLSGHVKPAQDGFASESSVEVHESDPVAVQAGQKPADLQHDLFRFMAYAG